MQVLLFQEKSKKKKYYVIIAGILLQNIDAPNVKKNFIVVQYANKNIGIHIIINTVHVNNCQIISNEYYNK